MRMGVYSLAVLKQLCWYLFFLMKIQQIKVESQEKIFEKSALAVNVKTKQACIIFSTKYFYRNKRTELEKEVNDTAIKMSSLFNLNPILNQKEITYYSCSDNIIVKGSFCYN